MAQDIFQAALELSPNDQSAYLLRACGDDLELQSEVASLLANDNVDTGVFHFAVAADLKGLAQAKCSADSGLRVGPYRVIRELDRGGMGIVYLAVRSDDHYFQIVAIKMVRLGMESRELIQRFRAERQILATLTHPNIGAILDGGDTEDGRPYIVMEYVEGQPITLASETRGLSLRQRIELFRSVCSAVHYAHQKLVIHRDIKPSNVLVTPEGAVKLIDFGISKSLAPELIPGELPPTEAGMRLMTLDYASPEQIRGQNITAAADIYSLGVLLYELVTGTRPYTLQDLSPANAERLVLEQEVRRPSSISGLSRQLRNELTGDLDRIILMAMDIDPARRYSSADDLDRDLLRFLEGMPVRARRATLAYRISKFVTRHKMASLMAIAIIVVFAGSFLFQYWQSRLTDQRVAQFEKIADAATSELMEQLRQSSLPVATQAALFGTALKSLDRLRQSSGNDPRVLLSLSTAYARMGDFEGSPFTANLGNLNAAAVSYEQALHSAMEAHERLHSEETSQAVIEAYERLGGIQAFLGKIPAARNSYQKGHSFARAFWQQKPPDPVRRRSLAISYAGMGDLQLMTLEPDEALKSFRSAFEAFGSEENGNDDHDQTLFKLYWNLGRTLNQLGRQSEALRNYWKSVAIAEGVARNFPSDRQAKRELFAAYRDIVLPFAGRDMLNIGDTKRAQVYARKALAIAEDSAAADAKNVQAHSDLAFAEVGMGDSFRLTQPATAAEWYRKAILLTREMNQVYEVRYWLAERDEALAEVLLNRKDVPERLHLLEEANAIRLELAASGANGPHDRVHLMRSFCNLSEAEAATRNLARARRHADSALPFFIEFKISSPSLVVLREMGFCFESMGKVEGQIATDPSLSPLQRSVAEASSRDWYTKSAAVWTEWERRGAATPESEVERHKLERLLQTR